MADIGMVNSQRAVAVIRNMDRICHTPGVAWLSESQYQDLISMQCEVLRLAQSNHVDEASRILQLARDFVCPGGSPELV